MRSFNSPGIGSGDEFASKPETANVQVTGQEPGGQGCIKHPRGGNMELPGFYVRYRTDRLCRNE
jgi:hypothetical protein